MKRIYLLVFFLLIKVINSSASVKLAAIFGDHMVLQQQQDVAIWDWAKPNQILNITTTWSKKSYQVKVSANGKWRTLITTPKAGGPYLINFNDGELFTLKDVLIGEVWLCGGQSNMEMPMKGFKNQPLYQSNEAIVNSTSTSLRLYRVPRWSTTQKQEDSKPSEWKLAAPESVSNFSATAYYFAKQLQALLGVPIGLISDNYGGSTIEAWMEAEELKSFPEVKVPLKTDSIKEVSRTPTTLYNGMIHPIIGFGIKGIIWYQGESNYSAPDLYLKLFPHMVASWRKAWNIGEFPFYYAQIAPFNYASFNNDQKDEKLNSAYLRDAQRKAEFLIPNAGMAVLMDVGDPITIHPPQKKAVGERLAYLALSKTYGIKGVGAQSPVFENLSIENSKATLKFKFANDGLTSYWKELSLFEIAGEDKKFYPAKAVINGSTVIVSSDSVKQPLAVRYAFKNDVKGDLFGNDGLPVSSFRTDNW